MATSSQGTRWEALPMLAPDSVDSHADRAQPPQGLSRWRFVAAAAVAAALVLVWAGSQSSERPSRAFLDEVIVKDEEGTDSCTDYMSSGGCAWTLKHNCPDQPAGSEGPAMDDGTVGYKCCCKRSLWKEGHESLDDGGDSEPGPEDVDSAGATAGSRPVQAEPEPTPETESETESEAEPGSQASNEDNPWTRREHPYFKAVKESCTQDLKKFCSSNSFKDRSFLLAVNCLAEKRDQLDEACGEAAFGGTVQKPHPKLFKIFKEAAEKELHVKVTADDGTTSTVRILGKIVVGYVESPLMYTTPSSTPIFRTWFSMVPAMTQPAPQGILFLHNGGPAPSMYNVFPAALSNWPFGKNLLYIRQNFDVVSVDQRGMGMSSLELLYGMTPDSLSVYKQNMKPLIEAVKESEQTKNGALFSQIHIPISHDVPNLVGETPCKMEETDYVDTGFFEPSDYANEEDVDNYFNKKAIITKYCSDKFDKDDGEGKKYSPLQYVGTGALTYDMEYMRLAFGGPKISILGYSYGTRVAAAYASAFPYNTLRIGVNGVMAPIPDLLEYAQKAAKNTAEIFGWIISQCAQEDTCSNNPWNESDFHDDFFEGGIDEAVNELITRSMDGGSWYTEHCGKSVTPLTLKGLTNRFRGLLTAGGPTDYQNSTWPTGFGRLPAMVYFILNDPCKAAIKFKLKISGESGITVFGLIPALDMTGRFDKIQAVKFVTTFASDPVFAPALDMFGLYAMGSYGWPQLPMPIGFSNQNVPAVIANTLYDERTGMAYAQDFKLHFPNSSLVTSLSGGHCVGLYNGPQAWELLVKFLINGSMPLDGTVTGEYIPIDFEMGSTMTLQTMQAPHA